MSFSLTGCNTVDVIPLSDNPKTPGTVVTVGVPEETDSEQAVSSESSFVNGVLTTPDMKIEITDYKIIPAGAKGNEYGDVPVIAFWYNTTNISGEDLDASTAWIFDIDVYQDNDPNILNELDMSYAFSDDSLSDNSHESIKKGGTVENAIAYELSDTVTDVTLVASELFGTDDIGTMTYKLA